MEADRLFPAPWIERRQWLLLVPGLPGAGRSAGQVHGLERQLGGPVLPIAVAPIKTARLGHQVHKPALLHPFWVVIHFWVGLVRCNTHWD